MNEPAFGNVCVAVLPAAMAGLVAPPEILILWDTVSLFCQTTSVPTLTVSDEGLAPVLVIVMIL